MEWLADGQEREWNNHKADGTWSSYDSWAAKLRQVSQWWQAEVLDDWEAESGLGGSVTVWDIRGNQTTGHKRGRSE